LTPAPSGRSRSTRSPTLAPEAGGTPRIGAALFNGDHARLGDELARLEQAGVDFVHLDVFDGTLVPDLGFPPRTIAALRPLTRLPFEAHLASADPLRLLPVLAEAGVDRVLFHVEGAPMVHETVFAVRELGMSAGVALGLGAPLAWLDSALPLVDAILLLSRVTGEGTRGASFEPGALPRLREARRRIDELAPAVELQVAGGVNRGNAPELLAAGAATLALGAGLYRVPDMAAEVSELRALA
jgi:ribulose-phosphate 3-epimerase